jgi:hypothetical protein
LIKEEEEGGGYQIDDQQREGEEEKKKAPQDFISEEGGNCGVSIYFFDRLDTTSAKAGKVRPSRMLLP